MRVLVLVAIFAFNIFALDATIEIVKKIDKQPKIVVINGGSSGVNKSIENKFFKLLIGDLKVSTHFQVKSGFIAGNYEDNLVSRDLANEGIELAIKAKIERESSNRLIASAKLINVQSGELLYEKFYAISKPKRYPFLAHNIAIDINKYFGFESIEWMKRYVIFARYLSPGESEIVVSDYTLSFKQSILKGGLNIFPKWANQKQSEFYYTSYRSGVPTLYKINLLTGERRKIISSNGMLICSDVSKDGTKLLLTMAPHDQPDIYLYDIKTKRKKRLTRYSGIDVGGSFVDDEKRIVFISERLGYPNIFAKNIGGGSVEQMVYHGKNNSSCSTYKNYIVYSSRESNSAFGRNTFNLYLISTKTDFIRKLTSNGKNMFPRFSENAESVLYIKYLANQSALGILRLNANKSFLFPLNIGRIQSIDW